MKRSYRVRKSFWGKCILQEWIRFPQMLPGAPMDYWKDVKWNDLTPRDMEILANIGATDAPKP